MSSAKKPAPDPLPELPHRPQTFRVLRRAYGYWRPYRRLVVTVYGLLLLITGLNMAMPQFIRWIIDEGIQKNRLSLLAWSVAALLGLTAFKGVLTFVQGRGTEIISQSVAYDIRNAIQTKLTQLSFSYHDQTEAGQLLSRALQDVERMRFLTGRATFHILNSVILLLGTTLILFWMNPLLALLAVGTMPFLTHRAFSFGKRYRPLSVEIQNQLGVLTSRLEQNLRGARTVKAFAQEQAEIDRFNGENESWFDMAQQAARLQAVNMPLLQLIADLGTVAIIWYGGRLVIEQGLTLGELVAFTTYLAQLTQPIRLLGMVIPAVAMAGSAGERIFEILDTEPEVQDMPEAITLPRIKGAVRFEDVSFAYPSRKRTLSQITLEARPGQIIALLGPTGAGKSTITNLVPRFYDPTAGRITIDGYDIRQVTLSSLRAQIGIVLQESILFAATIRENIAFGHPDASEAEIIAAAQAAQAHPFISEMPAGYDTDVGERGVTLSGGQKQRLAIARALLTDPRTLILDDATASVDTETERLLQKALARLMQGRTTFVIAHRLSTVRRADLILVLERGSIVARGTHESLLETSPLYADIYHRQLKPQEAAETAPVSSMLPWLAKGHS